MHNLCNNYLEVLRDAQYPVKSDQFHKLFFFIFSGKQFQMMEYTEHAMLQI